MNPTLLMRKILLKNLKNYFSKIKDTYPVGKITFIIELASIVLVLLLTYFITQDYFYLLIPLLFILSVISLINFIINKTENYYSEKIIFTFETLIVALLVATFAITGLYPWLFLPFFIQLLIVILIVSYKVLNSQSENLIDNRVKLYKKSLQNVQHNQNAEWIRLKIDHYKYEETNNIIKQNLPKIKAYGISSAILLFISIYLVWYFPYVNEKAKEEKNISQYEKLIKNIDSLKISVISLKDSLYKTMKLNEAVIEKKHIKENKPNNKTNERIKTMNDIK